MYIYYLENTCHVIYDAQGGGGSLGISGWGCADGTLKPSGFTRASSD